MTIKNLEEHWNNKHPKMPILYTGRAIPKKCSTCNNNTLTERVEIDVCTMLSSNDFLCQKIIKDYNLKAKTFDETMYNIQKWVVKNIKYIGDDLSQGTVEYWQFPYETIKFKNGDCEDGALLIAALAINCGIPAFRVRVVAGMVQPSPTAPEGGHGYVSYLREFDNKWVVIDWCYLEDSNIPVKHKTVQSKNTFYKNVWFSFNHQFSWSNSNVKFNSF